MLKICSLFAFQNYHTRDKNHTEVSLCNRLMSWLESEMIGVVLTAVR